MVKLLGISGSLRAGSYNTMLVREAARVFAPDEFSFADLRLPLYDGDLEARGMPESVLTLCDQIRAADAIVISTPEYNKNPSGVLKNALDWVSRVRPVAEVEVAAGNAASRFDEHGRLTGEHLPAALERQMAALRACPGPGPGAASG